MKINAGNTRFGFTFLKKVVFTILCSLYGVVSYAQQDTMLLRIANGITAASHYAAREKIYMQTDKPDYVIGDTLWFKSYLFNASDFNASGKSGVLYVEIADADNQIVKRMMVSLIAGLGWGDIPLKPDAFPEGNYTLRGYTNWMRNFGQRDIFQKQFSVRDFSNQNWLVNSQFHVLPQTNNADVQANLQLKQINGKPLSFRDVSVALVDGNKILHQNKFRTDVNGNAGFDFNIPDKADLNKVSIDVTDLRTGQEAHRVTIPVILSGSDGVDLQFMPEGGAMIAGVRNLIAFKAVSRIGMGAEVSGNIYNSGKQKVAAFHSSHVGMGKFYFVPQTGESYTAQIRLSNGQVKSYPLPEARHDGVLLHVDNPLGSDSIQVNILTAGNAAEKTYYITGQSRGIGLFAARIILENGREDFFLNKDIFPTGITRLTILNDDKQPICQRMLFIDHHDQLLPHFEYKESYYTRDSIQMKLKVTDNAGAPVIGDFSVAVTDDAGVRIDTAKRISLLSYTLLSSDLKGYIEFPGYYFQTPMTKDIWNNLDNLLLTQGWVSYDLDNNASPEYKPEQTFSVAGKVLNAFNKPVARSHVILISERPFALMDTVTGKSGRFAFSNLYPIDTASYFIQAKNKRGKSFNVGIELNAFRPPVFTPIKNSIIPWYVNIDTGRLHIAKAQIAYHEQLNKLLGKHVLKEVVIKGEKFIKDSKNLNGPGSADITLNQSDMEKAGDATLGDILRKRVKGFHLGGKRLDLYKINDETLHLIIDGVNVDFFKPEGDTERDFYNNYLNYLTAKDIKGIEVMTSARFTGKYFQRFLNPMDKPFVNGFIEVTTYSGNGAFLKKTPGVYLYKPGIAFRIPDKFYVPKYSAVTSNELPDLRSTIYWQPNVITNENGEALIKFYTADKAGIYTLIMEGADMNGRIGSVRKKIIVK